MVNSAEPVLAEVRRGAYLEAQHHGSVVVLTADGAPALSIGDVDSLTLPRSAVKPFQAIAMLRHGLDVAGPELALAGASHSGEPFHIDAATSILEGCGLSPAALQTPPALPGDEEALIAWCGPGRAREPIAHNCSGKHAAMLRTCVRAGWSIDNYRSPAHPLQVAAKEAISEFTGERIGAPVVDGCGAPAFPVTLTGLARSFGVLAAAQEGEAARVADAYRQFPTYVSGTTRSEVVFHREVPGLVCKVGAEGAFAIGLPDGTGIATKTSDGNLRGSIVVLVAILDALGFGTDALRGLDPYPVLGHGEPVGRVSLDESVAAKIAGQLRPS